MDLRPGVLPASGDGGFARYCARQRGLHVDRAHEIVARVVSPVSGAEIVPLNQAAGRVLSSPVHSPVPLPHFDHAAVDGYCLQSTDAAKPESRLPIVAHVLAGDMVSEHVSGSALRIMTGAPVPAGCDAVVKQEHTIRNGSVVTITDAIRPGANIRRVGEDVGRGDLLVDAGTVLDTRHIALLAACGIPTVRTVSRVRIAIAAFGAELEKPGADLQPGHIFDANTSMATAFMARPSCRIAKTVRAGDDRAGARALLLDLAGDADLIITSGGMAGGDADYTLSALEEAGGHWEHLAFDMKPGRPARLGRIGATVVLGLPGNPFAALVALLVLGVPILARLTGGRDAPKWLWGTAAFALDRQRGITEFFPARVIESASRADLAIERMGKGGSARLRPLVDADGLGRIDAQSGNIAEGDKIRFMPFSSMFG